MQFERIKLKIFIYHIVFIIGTFASLISQQKESLNIKKIPIVWTDSLTGDFSFQNDWKYPEGVIINEFGQLDCDGICPPEIDNMKDNTGKILIDSLEAFYRYVDTSHIFQSILSDAWCYEWNGTDYITVRKIEDDIYECFTHLDIATHSSLKMKFINNYCFPTIELTSVTDSNIKTFPCKTGKIQIDRILFLQGILKAVFSFTFENYENSEKTMYWKGKIYAKIDK